MIRSFIIKIDAKTIKRLKGIKSNIQMLNIKAYPERFQPSCVISAILCY